MVSTVGVQEVGKATMGSEGGEEKSLREAPTTDPERITHSSIHLFHKYLLHVTLCKALCWVLETHQ